jgi:integrase
MKPEKLTTPQLQKYREKRAKDFTLIVKRDKNGSIGKDPNPERRVGQSTINRELAVLRASLKYILKTNQQVYFPLPLFPMTDERRNVRKGFLSEQQFRLRYDKLPYWGVKALTAASFYTGVRRGELRLINWDQVDFRAGVITIYDTKNGNSREIPILDGMMLESLREAKRERDRMYPGCQAAFAYNGKRLGDPKRSWRTAAEDGVANSILIHDLRRSGNRYLRDIGVPRPIRLSIMGHETDSMDKRYGIVDRTDMDIVRELHRRKQQEKTTAETTTGPKTKSRKSA